jgi:hypothetical protein
MVQVLVLLSQPCEELFPDPSETNDRQYVSRYENGSTSEQQQDECSPFCLCSCCSHPVANQTFSFAITTHIEQSKIENTFTDYANPITTTYTDSVWQPPKA